MNKGSQHTAEQLKDATIDPTTNPPEPTPVREPPSERRNPPIDRPPEPAPKRIGPPPKKQPEIIDPGRDKNEPPRDWPPVG